MYPRQNIVGNKNVYVNQIRAKLSEIRFSNGQDVRLLQMHLRNFLIRTNKNVPPNNNSRCKLITPNDNNGLSIDGISASALEQLYNQIQPGRTTPTEEVFLSIERRYLNASNRLHPRSSRAQRAIVEKYREDVQAMRLHRENLLSTEATKLSTEATKLSTEATKLSTKAKMLKQELDRVSLFEKAYVEAWSKLPADASIEQKTAVEGLKVQAEEARRSYDEKFKMIMAM